jgi:hypothetical protein
MSGSAESARLIEEALVSATPRAVVAGPELLSSLPRIDESFAALDQRYLENRSAYLGELAGTVEDLPGFPGIVVSLLADDRVADIGKIGVMKAPLDSTHPHSTPYAAASYAAKGEDEAGFWEQQRVKPNTWNEVGKLATNYEIAVQQGVGMPMATIYSPVPAEIFTKEELKQIAAGDTSPWGRVFTGVVDYAQERLHGKDGETRLKDAYFFEPGMGHEAVGAVDYTQVHDVDYQVKGLITPNLIAGVRNRAILLARYSVLAQMGDKSDLIVPENYLRIPEPLMRRDLDKKGAELGMRLRQARAIIKMFNPGAMVHSEWLQGAMERLVENGTAFVAPISVHANIARNTTSVLPMGHPNFWLLPVMATQGDYADLSTNENYSLGAVEMVEGILFADDLQKKHDGNTARV